jgi:hypothetical protein
MNPSLDDNVLLCPCCGDNYLHHGQVCTFTRATQDADSGIAFRIDAGGNGSISRSSQLKGNPSSRRDGITVDFTCENCGNTSTLGIAQHKGQTLLNWQPRQWTVITDQDGGIG